MWDEQLHGTGSVPRKRRRCRDPPGAGVAAAAEIPVRQRFCRFCDEMFFICRPCDRGQRYCGVSCRETARREQRRRANRRNQRSPEGRDNHRRLQADYRARVRRRRVTDQGSQSDEPSKNLALPSASGEPKPPRRFDELICVVCKGVFRVVDPFDKVRWRR